MERQALVISESDIDAALAHLRSLPHSATAKLPYEWGRKRLLDTIQDEIDVKNKVGDCVAIAPGVWALIKPFGVDLMMRKSERTEQRHQVWLLVRPAGTDPNKITEIHRK